MASQSFDEVLENAFLDGDCTTLFNFFVEKSNDDYQNYSINKINFIASNLSSLPENEVAITNILSILMELNGVLEFNFEQISILVKYVLLLITDETSPLGIVKRAAHILNTYFSNTSIIDWLKNDESLEGSLQILGRKIPIIGDYECQTFIFEALCRFITDDENKIKWAHAWFPDDKTRSLFLNLNPPQFEMDCRKVLNHINRNEQNPRTYAFVATSVYFGSFEVKKPYGQDFWIDFNYDSQSISFFCSEFGPDLLYDNSASWETVLISSDVVDYYSVQNKRIMKSKELCISLKCKCDELLPVEYPIYPQFQTNLVRITFWSFLDISQPLEKIFGKPVDLANECTESQEKNSVSRNCRKVSNSADVLSIQKETGDRMDTRKVSHSSILEISEEKKQQERNNRRVSESADVIHLFDTNKEEQTDSCNLLKIDSCKQKKDSLCKRKVSYSSMNLKESDDESDFQINGIKKHSKVKQTHPPTDKHSVNVEKLIIEREIEYYQHQDIQKHQNVEKSFNISNSVKKSSNASCIISLKSDDSLSNVDEQIELNASESELNCEKNVFCQTNNLLLNKVLSNINETQSLNLSQRRKMLKIDGNNQIKGKNCIFDYPETLTSSNEEKNPLCKDLKTRKNVDDLNISLEIEKANVSAKENSDSQNFMEVKNSVRKISQSFSDLEETCISPTPVNKRKTSRKTNKLISKPHNDYIISENHNFDKNPTNINKEEHKIPNKITDDNNKKNLKNSNSEPYNDKDVSPNSRQKKIRLYNINKDPVYDVPPHQKKRLNDNIKKNYSPLVKPFHTDQYQKVLSNSTETNNEDTCKIKESVNILHKKPSDLLIAENNLHPTLSNFENILSNEGEELESIVPVNEEKSSKEDKSENGHLINKKSVCNEPKQKKLKIYHDSDSDYSVGRKLKRKTCDIEKEAISQPLSVKKPRRAALRAMKKNKTILEQKTSEKGSEISNFDQLPESSVLNFDKIEENICTPATKPVKKQRLKNKSVFMTDTETGSSEVSWFGQKRSYLFETPKKCYSSRKKNKQEANNSYSNQRMYKSRNVNSGSKKNQNSVSLLSETELNPKNTLSDLENYELLIERKSDYKSASHLNQDYLGTTETIWNALEAYDFEKKSDSENNQVYSNIDARMHKTSNYSFEKEFDVQNLGGNDYFTRETITQAEIISENLRPNVTNVLNMNKVHLKQSTSKETKSRNAELTSPEKNLNVDFRIESVSEQLSLSSSTKKRKSVDFSAFNEGVKKMKKNYNVAHNISLDTITNSENNCNTYEHLTGNGSLLLASNNSCNLIYHLSKTPNNHFPNVPISLETRLKESPIVSKSNRSDLLKNKLLKKKYELDNYIPVKNIWGILSQESLCSLDNEINGKKLHMQRFLESLSGESNSPKDVTQNDNGKNNSSIFKESSNEIMKHSNFEEDETPFVKNYIHSEKNNKQFTSIYDSKSSLCSLNTRGASEKEIEKLPLLDNNSNYWSIEEKTNNCKKIRKNKEKNGSKPFTILNLLVGEVNNLTRRLLGTLQKYSRDFAVKVASLRENILVTASALISEDSELAQKDLKNLAITCKQSRIHVEKSLKKILSVGQEYFEAEKRHDHKMKQLHRKAVKKYAARIKIARKIATKALEETVISKTNAFLKNIVKKIDHI
ncbi:synaptonemal complex protein 2 [Nephila pilipes]|uniref:Synaptonemal complex protein 2 n=1 Tax=Nephila pilipes TaxID=299642 RepID=A0A8X6U7K6_NEPPI|nr:synaptonemal complex protein 2 [Nephila pilipes]